MAITGPARNPTSPNQPGAWADPANLAFDDARRRLLVANHAHMVGTDAESLFAVFDVFVDDEGEPLFTP